MSTTLLGPIVRLQVQRDPVKAKGAGYDPTPILSVAEAAVGPSGLVGRHDGGWVVDAHHAAHPQVRGGGRRALSMGFSEHYDRIAARFGSAPIGCGGENVIVATDRRIDLDELAGSLVIITAGGEVPLTGARVAAPCLEFTSFLLGRPEVGTLEELAEDLEFLDGGTRGYILEVAHLERPYTVRLGDEVVVETDVRP